MDPDLDERITVLAAFLGVEKPEIRPAPGKIYTFRAFYCGPGHASAYLVLTPDEADRAVRLAVKEKIWLIALESTFQYFDIDASPSELPEKISSFEIREANRSLLTLIENSCGIRTLTDRMTTLGNRPGLLADYDQEEHPQGRFLIYRLF